MSTTKSYEEIMGFISQNTASASVHAGGNEKSATVQALSRRLVAFRQWLQNDARATIHPAICIVNGEATDGTKNAPVLILDQQQPDKKSNMDSGGSIGTDGFQSSNYKDPAVSNAVNSNMLSTDLKKANSIYEGRVGVIDTDIANTVLYDKTMGCQIRTVKELKKDEVMMTLPRTSMITPDLVAASDAGKALWACCKAQSLPNPPASSNGCSMWDVLENTTHSESSFLKKVACNTGPQTLVKILQERKRAEMAYKKRVEEGSPQGTSAIELAEPGTISTRAPFLLFLIHQRFFHSERVPVASTLFLDVAADSASNCVLHSNTYMEIQLPPNAPVTFAPYARTLPSSVSIPLCWKRNEIAMLAGCIPGLSILQDVAANTMQLASEFITLIHAGILERFPNTFPPGFLSWDRYVWAAAVFSSRNLPATSYYNMGDIDAFSFHPSDPLEFQSPPEIWDEVGVLIPLLDMLNHEVEDHQITWEPCRSTSKTGNSNDSDDPRRESVMYPRAIVHKKVKKGSEVFCCYGHNISNSNLILQYGFAQINNTSDEVRLGWAISDAVGKVDPPADFTPSYANHGDYVYESTDENAINSWWTAERISLLEREICAANMDVSFITNLKSRKKMIATAYADGSYYPLLLSAIVVATLQMGDVAKLHLSLTSSADEKGKHGRTPIVISKRHQKVIQRYLQFSFTRKLEKLLQNLDSGLKGHFPNVKLWTKSSKGGLSYLSSPIGESVNGNSNGDFIGWQSFFDSNAYKATMEVENGYYAMGTASCVLALYDGQLRALQTSLDGVTDSKMFASGVLKQLEDLGFQIAWDGEEVLEEPNAKTNGIPSDDTNHIDGGGVTNQNETENESDSPRNRKRNKKKTASNNGSATSDEKTPAVKLHVGNLAFTTTPADLFEYFSSIYGQDNVLECHIPIERETGRSRGFGFVAMPEEIALGALQSDRKHEVDGRVLKVARSNSVGAVSNIKPPAAPPQVNSERCLTCGYRPRYCICSQPNVPAFNGKPAAPPSRPYVPLVNTSSRLDPVLDHEYRPSDYRRDDDYRRGNYYHDDGGRFRDYDRDHRYQRQHHHDDDEHRRLYDRDEDYYNRSRGRDRRDRSPPRDDRTHGSRGSSRRWEDYDDRERSSSSYRRDDLGDDLSDDDYDRGRKRSRSKEKSSRRKKGKRRHRSRSSGSSDSRT
jgi:RNA recognition motif-containing protein